MNFRHIFFFVFIILAVNLQQSQASWLTDLKEKSEQTFQYVKNAALEVIEVGQKAADVAATARGDKH
ncbi:sarcotoxin-1B-like [Drosophila erecta]|uniref:GG11742 n=1 Tax=Drosophila erecta TaxID=7220 RepID=B3P5A7_DROER|nr:sarcotoxin-1B-like [Drosophila erecta]